MGPFKDIAVELDKDMVATIEIRRPPHNFFDIELIRQIADACEALDKDDQCRAVVLAAQGTAFCAGAKLGGGADVQDVLVKKSESRPGRASLHRGGAPVPHEQADRRRHPRRGRRRRARPGAGAGHARDVPRGALLRPTSPGSASIRASGSPTRCRR